ncbi:hypothetical protein [Variovorax rhizosphaerae]|uniref:Uncharacterized protein n=1 Tax=Variovorax rhizosphaerae TaxID=1836200 RepID=A0ABU8WQB3_9BURK
MPSLREEYCQVTDALEAAYLADKTAYEALPRRNKGTWALQPPQSWPTTDEFSPWFAARVTLLKAEQRVLQVLRTRCALIRQNLGHAGPELPDHAAPVEQTIETAPDEFHPTEFMPMHPNGDEPGRRGATERPTSNALNLVQPGRRILNRNSGDISK